MTSDGEPKETSPRAKLALGAFLAVVLGGSMIVLVVVLVGASREGRRAIEAYVASIKAGAPVSPQLAGDEAEAVTKALRESTSFSISNFQGQQGTSCFWVTLRGGASSVDARFVLAEGASAQGVTAVSLARSCECPVDSDKPCQLARP